MSPRRLVLALALGIIVTVPASRPDAQTAPAAGAALSGLPSSLLAAFEAGKAVFRTEEAPATGLGPVFNAKSCLECHSQPATGGSGMTASTFAMRFARHVEGEPFDPLLALGGPALQSRSVSEVLPGCSLAPESIPAVANHTERRQPPPLFGLGLIAAIPEATIAANADPNDVNGDGIAGRVNHINGMLGRFGWKAAGTTLTDFVALAMIGELGVTNPLFRMEMAPQGVPAPAGCDIAADPEDNGSRLFALVDFLTYLAPPPRGTITDAVRRGETLFGQIGCAGCHTPVLTTGPNAIAALDRKPVALYSDLLVHYMGGPLNDHITEGAAGGGRWRTAPLWGLRFRRFFLHDGRTSDLTEAIRAHAGTAKTAKQRFNALTPAQRQDVLAFLRSL